MTLFSVFIKHNMVWIRCQNVSLIDWLFGSFWFLTLLDPLTHPCHTDPVASWPGKRSLPRPPIGSQPRRRPLCQPPGARTRTPHSVLLGTTSSPRRDTCDDNGNLSQCQKTISAPEQFWCNEQKKTEDHTTLTDVDSGKKQQRSSVFYSLLDDSRIQGRVFYFVLTGC